MNDSPAPATAPRSKRLVMAFCLLLAMLAFLEIGLRILGIGGSIIYREDPDCGYLPIPDQQFSTMGHSIRILTNGYRGPFTNSDTLFIGDSVTYGTAYVRDEDTFAARMRGLNGGVNGWGIQNAAGYVRSRPLPGIRQVVLVVPSCDVLRPYMTLRKGLISTNRRMWFRLEYLFRFVWYGFIKTQPAPVEISEYEKNLAAIQDAHDRLSKRGIELIVVFLPYREEAMGKTMTETPFVQRMIAALRASGVTCHTVQPTGDAAKYYRDTAHLTAEGNRWVAEELGKVIKVNGR